MTKPLSDFAPWTPIDTPFGRIYIDKWGDDVDRECQDRITLYDSNGEWLDYFPINYFYETFDPSVVKLSEEDEAKAYKEYQDLVEMLRLGAETDTCEGFMDWLGVNFLYVGANRDQAIHALWGDDFSEEDRKHFDDNEWVNHIGDNYVVVAEI